MQHRRLDAGQPPCVLQRVVLDEGGVGFEVGRRGLAGIGGAGSIFLQLVVGAQAVTDIGLRLQEQRVVADEFLVHPAGGDDVVGDEVQDREVGARLKDHRQVCEVGTAVSVGGQH